jgi:hypothetical protein
MGHLTRDFFFKVTVLSFIGALSLTRGRVCHVSVLVALYSRLCLLTHEALNLFIWRCAELQLIFSRENIEIKLKAGTTELRGATVTWQTPVIKLPLKQTRASYLGNALSSPFRGYTTRTNGTPSEKSVDLGCC